MSRLTDKIDAVQTGRVRSTLAASSMAVIKDELFTPADELYTEYRIGVTLKSIMQIKGNSSTELVFAKDRCKRRLIEEVFGEFRPHFRKIEGLLYNLDVDAARLALMELENEMFT